MDNIIIFSTSSEEHLLPINQVFDVLRAANLLIQIDKSEFMKRETKFLGHVVTTGGIKPNPKKFEAIQNFAIPRTTTQIK